MTAHDYEQHFCTPRVRFTAHALARPKRDVRDTMRVQVTASSNYDSLQETLPVRGSEASLPYIVPTHRADHKAIASFTDTWRFPSGGHHGAQRCA